MVAQEADSGQVLMQGYVNPAALEKTIRTGYATFWSTSRQCLWTKGETSGEYLEIKDILIDCDQDALIYQVHLTGTGVCHTKQQDGKPRKACFYRKLNRETGKLEFINEMR